ncbi:MAG: glycosyltransferase [Acidimicrobiales bacterium]
MKVLHQLVPSVNPGDATTAHTLQVQEALRQAGYESEVFALAVPPSLEHRVRLLPELTGPSRAGGHLLYQYSTFSELGDWLFGRRERAILNYHNITPPRFFRPWNRAYALAMRAGELQLAQLARQGVSAVCVSSYNEADLRARGVSRTAVVPVLVDLAGFDVEPDPATTGMLTRRRHADSAVGAGPVWLFVGTVAPHKAQHELVQALAVYRTVYDPTARLHLVGRVVSKPYAAALERYVHRLGLEDAVEITGGVSHEALVAYYADADVFVSLSHHEGFCVPVLEAMHHGLPVVVRRAGALPETVGRAGLVLDDDSPHGVAAALQRVLADAALRRQLAAAGHTRLGDFSLVRTRPAFVACVESLMASDAEAA